MTVALEVCEWSAARPGHTFNPGKDLVPIVQEVGWGPGPVWMGGKSRPHWDSIPNRPARSQSLYWLSYPHRISVAISWSNCVQFSPLQNCVMRTVFLMSKIVLWVKFNALQLGTRLTCRHREWPKNYLMWLILPLVGTHTLDPQTMRTSCKGPRGLTTFSKIIKNIRTVQYSPPFNFARLN